MTYESVRESVIATLNRWRPPDPGQDALREAMLAFALARPDCCRRDCEPGHVTASTLLFDHTGTQVALTLHPRLSRWVQLGGHCEDGDSDIVAAARREATEESGLAGPGIPALVIEPLPVAIHVHPLTCSLGVPTRHLDVQFVGHAPRGAELRRSAESVDLRWWPITELPADSDHALAQLVSAACTRADTQTSVE